MLVRFRFTFSYTLDNSSLNAAADKDCLKGNQTQIEVEILKDFKTIVPPDTKLIILADRGFGNIELFEIYCKHYNGPLEKLVVEPDTLRSLNLKKSEKHPN